MSGLILYEKKAGTQEASSLLSIPTVFRPLHTSFRKEVVLVYTEQASCTHFILDKPWIWYTNAQYPRMQLRFNVARGQKVASLRYGFALTYLPEQAPVSKAPLSRPATAGRRRAHSLSAASAPAPPPLRRSSFTEDEQEIGHFCYPDLPGFCEANFCIFHAPSAPREAELRKATQELLK